MTILANAIIASIRQNQNQIGWEMMGDSSPSHGLSGWEILAAMYTCDQRGRLMAVTDCVQLKAAIQNNDTWLFAVSPPDIADAYLVSF